MKLCEITRHLALCAFSQKLRPPLAGAPLRGQCKGLCYRRQRQGPGWLTSCRRRPRPGKGRLGGMTALRRSRHLAFLQLVYNTFLLGRNTITGELNHLPKHQSDRKPHPAEQRRGAAWRWGRRATGHPRARAAPLRESRRPERSRAALALGSPQSRHTTQRFAHRSVPSPCGELMSQRAI